MRTLFTLFVLGLLFAACSGGDSPPADEAPPEQVTEEAGDRHFEGVGVVEALDEEAGTVTIDHEEIPDFMAAMTMTYDLADPSILEGIEPGAKVEFGVLVKEDGSYYVDQIAQIQ